MRYVKLSKEQKLMNKLMKQPNFIPRGEIRIDSNNDKGFILNPYTFEITPVI